VDVQQEIDKKLEFESFRNRQGEGKIHKRNDCFTFNLNFAVTKLIDKIRRQIDIREEFSAKQSNKIEPLQKLGKSEKNL